MDRAQERREPATPRRREQARRRGQTVRSLELASAATLLAAGLALHWSGPEAGRLLAGLFRDTLGRPPAPDWTAATVLDMVASAAAVGLRAAAPVVLATALAGVAFNLAQAGLVWAPGALAPALGRLNPAEGLRRILSRRAVAEFLKAAAKVAVVAVAMYGPVAGEWETLLGLAGPTYGGYHDLGASLAVVLSVAQRVLFRAAAALLALGVLDYAYQRWEHEASLRMTRQEVKEEFRETEGDPRVRGRIRERQRKIALQRMMAAVPKADVVVTNPTHLAVALRYEAGQMAAPRVVAKGRGHLAERIKAVARRAGVPCVENRPLAQALYAACEVGQAIPEALYQAVAEVLAFVYRLKGKVG